MQLTDDGGTMSNESSVLGQITESEPPAVLLTQGKDIGFLALYTLAVLGTFSGVMTPIISTLPLKVHALVGSGSAASLSLILSAGSFAALLTGPLVGKISDETRSAIGMRKP